MTSGASEPVLLKFHLEPTRGMKDCLNGCGPLTQMAAMPICGKKPIKVISRTEDALWLNLCINHRGREVCQSC